MDLDELFAGVVLPVLDQVLRPGELTAVSVLCPLPWSGPPRGDVLLRVVAVREELGMWLRTAGQAAEGPVALRAPLASDLQDHIAESRSGWSQLASTGSRDPRCAPRRASSVWTPASAHTVRQVSRARAPAGACRGPAWRRPRPRPRGRPR